MKQQSNLEAVVYRTECNDNQNKTYHRQMLFQIHTEECPNNIRHYQHNRS